MFEKPNIWLASIIIGLFAGLVTGLGVFLAGFTDYVLAGMLALAITTTGLLGLSYANELYTHIVWHRSERAQARKDRAKAVALARQWADWNGEVSNDGGLEDDQVVIEERQVPVNHGHTQSTFTARSVVSAEEWTRRRRAIEFMKWAYVLGGVTSPLMVGKAVGSARDWTAITAIMVTAGLLAKKNGTETQIMLHPMTAIEQIEQGRVMLTGVMPKVNECPLELFAARVKNAPAPKGDAEA